MKMADMDIDPFSDHDKTDAQPDTGETIPFTPEGVIEGGSSWEPERETSFGGTSQRTEVLKEHDKALYRMLSEETGQTLEVFQFDNFEYINGKLYYKGKGEPLMTKPGKLRSFGEITKILGKKRLRVRFRHT